MDWKPIESAPKDTPIYACEEAHGYFGNVIWNGSEWEAVNFQGSLMGIGFYPTHWAPITSPSSPPDSLPADSAETDEWEEIKQWAIEQIEPEDTPNPPHIWNEGGEVSEQTVMVPVDSEHPSHANMFKTLNLLRLFTRSGEPVYFVVEGCAIHDANEPLNHSYFYDEHSCPTNYVQVAAIMTREDDDPHGVFEYVRSVWMPHDYDEEAIDVDNEQLFRRLFPEIDQPVPEYLKRED
jgi:hypothetical protein